MTQYIYLENVLSDSVSVLTFGEEIAENDCYDNKYVWCPLSRKWLEIATW